MNVYADTSVLSVMLRRRVSAPRSKSERQLHDRLLELAENDLLVVPGIIRQELLSGIRVAAKVEAIRSRMNVIRTVTASLADHDLAADLYNKCRAQGVAPSSVDMLLCAIAIHGKGSVMTSDRDFLLYQKCFDLKLDPTLN
jgi:predicted nucleic acid-binding protein